MIKGIVTFLDDSPSLHVTIGAGEDLKAPRDLAAMEKQGWVITDGLGSTYKAWLALKRQGDVPADSKFEVWIENVAEVDLRPSARQLKETVIMGKMTQEQADALLALMEDESGESVAPPAA